MSKNVFCFGKVHKKLNGIVESNDTSKFNLVAKAVLTVSFQVCCNTASECVIWVLMAVPLGLCIMFSFDLEGIEFKTWSNSSTKNFV